MFGFSIVKPPFNMFISAVCVLFLIKLRWPKNKSIYDIVEFIHVKQFSIKSISSVLGFLQNY